VGLVGHPGRVFVQRPQLFQRFFQRGDGFAFVRAVAEADVGVKVGFELQTIAVEGRFDVG
jgi:hypothetical protein